MKILFLVRQRDRKDSSAAALAMILRYFGIKVSMATIRKDVGMDQYGASVAGILEAAGMHGLKTDVIKEDGEEIWDRIEKGTLPMPAILRMVNFDEYEHFVVVKGMKRDKLIIYDPEGARHYWIKEYFRVHFLRQVIVFHKKPVEAKERKAEQIEA